MKNKITEFENVVFILGYDLLHDAFARSDTPETDVVLCRCVEIAEDFMNSSFNRADRGLYTCVCDYLEWSDSFKNLANKFGICY